jgi:hypothetical protein
MLEKVVSAYLDSVSEREFDEPFLAVLRRSGFDDIHFLHGPFEFGKDFIAKKSEAESYFQYAFQSKAGNIDAGAWRSVRNQIEDMRLTSLAHPNFDREAARRVVLVTTGRLVGQAPISAQEYGNRLKEEDGCTFEVWDRETLIALLSQDLGTLAGPGEGEFLTLIGKVDIGVASDVDLERYSRRWHSSPATEALGSQRLMECAILANRLRTTQRLDLACYVSLCFLRSSLLIEHGSSAQLSKSDVTLAELAKSLFLFYADQIWRECTEGHFDSRALFTAAREAGGLVTYPVRCSKLMEILGLLALVWGETGHADASRVVEFLNKFVESQPGCAHPISDRWAVSLIPAVLALAKRRETVTSLLSRTTKWLIDHYENDKIGLASEHSSATAEVEYLLGDPLEHVSVKRRPESLVASVVMDLAAILGLKDVYETLVHDCSVAQLYPVFVHVSDDESQYLPDSAGLRREVNLIYDVTYSQLGGWKSAPHHRSAHDYWLDRMGRSWDLLAVSAVLRDRYFLFSILAYSGRNQWN